MERINQAVLQTILDQSKETYSDAVLIFHNGQEILSYYRDKPKKIELMSITKSIVALAIGKLWSEIKLDLETSVVHYYPEWNQGNKKLITIRQILNHTSGLQDDHYTDTEIEPSFDYIQLALTAELTSNPGKSYSYSNKAINLLAGIVKKISGQSLDIYMRDEIFAPLSINDFNWQKDRAGNPIVMTGLSLLPEGLIKLGQLVLDRGIYQGKRIIAEKWFDLMFEANQHVAGNIGLLWFILEKKARFMIDDVYINYLKQNQISDRLIEKLDKYKNNDLSSDKFTILSEEIQKESQIKNKRLLYGRYYIDEISGYLAESAIDDRGPFGQYLIILPKERIVALRMVDQTRYWEDFHYLTDQFIDFPDLVQQIVEP